MNSQNLNKPAARTRTGILIPTMAANKAAAVSVLESLKAKYATVPAAIH
jgi:hypothetical protein